MTQRDELSFDTTPRSESYDAVVVGSGPNGLACAITLAKAGFSVLVMEAAATIGGGMRSRELTQPGFIHDVCAAVHPLGVASRFFRELPLEEHGLEWVYPEASVVHAYTPDQPLVLYPSVERTVEGLGRDGKSYEKLVRPLLRDPGGLLDDILGPFNLMPRHPLTMLRFGWNGMRSTTGLAKTWFREPETPALFAGLAGHSILPLEKKFTAAVGLMFAVMGHMVSWPIAKGGSGEIAAAMARYFCALGGEIVVDSEVSNLDQVPSAHGYFFDTIPQDMIRIAGDRLPASFAQRIERFRHGPAVFKMDWALDGPVPWKDPRFSTAATVHIGGTLETIADAERACWENRVPDKPFVLFSQQSLFDSSRAPDGKHTGWAYCHVPHASENDYCELIESRIEHFAPGFRDLILDRHVMNPAAMNRYNANYVGGDITGGVMDLPQLFSRPVKLFRPYSTPANDIYLCSSSTPPGPGVHGMCGYHAALQAMKRLKRDTRGTV